MQVTVPALIVQGPSVSAELYVVLAGTASVIVALLICVEPALWMETMYRIVSPRWICGGADLEIMTSVMADELEELEEDEELDELELDEELLEDDELEELEELEELDEAPGGQVTSVLVMPLWSLDVFVSPDAEIIAWFVIVTPWQASVGETVKAIMYAFMSPGASGMPGQLTVLPLSVQGASVCAGLKVVLVGTMSVIVAVACVEPTLCAVTMYRMVSPRWICGGPDLWTVTSLGEGVLDDEELEELEEDEELDELELEELEELDEDEELEEAPSGQVTAVFTQPLWLLEEFASYGSDTVAWFWIMTPWQAAVGETVKAIMTILRSCGASMILGQTTLFPCSAQGASVSAGLKAVFAGTGSMIVAPVAVALLMFSMATS